MPTLGYVRLPKAAGVLLFFSYPNMPTNIEQVLSRPELVRKIFARTDRFDTHTLGIARQVCKETRAAIDSSITRMEWRPVDEEEQGHDEEEQGHDEEEQRHEDIRIPGRFPSIQQVVIQPNHADASVDMTALSTLGLAGTEAFAYARP